MQYWHRYSSRRKTFRLVKAGFCGARVRLDVRIITATNLDLKQEVGIKNFREDLFYRINTMEITLPPLRERLADKIPLAEFLLNKMIVKYKKGTT